MEDLRLGLATEIMGDKDRALKLIKLIDMTVNKGGSFPENLKMVLPKEENLNKGEETCAWNDNGECWVCMPDSMSTCSGKCGDYWKKK